MRLSFQRGAAIVAVIAGLGAGFAMAPTAVAGVAEGIAAARAGNYNKAIQEYQPLAEKGDATAQYLLAEIYFGGHGGSLPEAVKWMTAAAEQGYAQAQARLGLIYATGRGVAIDNVRAYHWFSLAAKLANPDSQKSLKTVSETNRAVVAKRLTPEQRKQADAEILAWKPNSSPKPAAATPAPATEKIGETIPGIRIQLAAVRNAAEAPKEWSRLQQLLGSALTGLSLTVETVDLGAKGVYRRIQAGPFPDKASAAAKCEAIKALKQDCLVVVRR
jgi:hypothetical protein